MKNILFVLVCLVFSCTSLPKEENVPKEMEVIDMIQKAQEAFEVNNYRVAKKWYEIILHRFGDDSAVRVEAEYELAHILVKQKRWKQAYQHLSLLIALYESKDGMRLPPDFYKLAKMDYEKVIKKFSPAYIDGINKKIENTDQYEQTNNDKSNSETISIEEADNDVGEF